MHETQHQRHLQKRMGELSDKVREFLQSLAAEKVEFPKEGFQFCDEENNPYKIYDIQEVEVHGTSLKSYDFQLAFSGEDGIIHIRSFAEQRSKEEISHSVKGQKTLITNINKMEKDIVTFIDGFYHLREKGSQEFFAVSKQQFDKELAQTLKYIESLRKPNRHFCSCLVIEKSGGVEVEMDSPDPAICRYHVRDASRPGSPPTHSAYIEIATYPDELLPTMDIRFYRYKEDGHVIDTKGLPAFRELRAYMSTFSDEVPHQDPFKDYLIMPKKY